MTNVTKANIRQQPGVRENQPPYGARSAGATAAARAPRPVAADLRRLVRRRASALLELEKN